MPDSNMFIVRKPQLVLENDQIYERSKTASAKLPCPVRPGGHSPKAIKVEVGAQVVPTVAWGWSHSIFQHGDHTDYAYFCEACHVLYFVELPLKGDE